MLYDYNTTLKIILRVYEYLRKYQPFDKRPHSIKMNKPLHRKMVLTFMERLHYSEGVDFIWEFLTFQFCIYSDQTHKIKPLPGWFLGKEAWKRWDDYKEGAKYYAKEWVSKNGFINPVRVKDYSNVTEEALLRERIRMSRISGPNFCVAKYGNSPFNEDSNVCMDCPFKKECRLLFSKTDGLYEKLIHNDVTGNCKTHVHVKIKKHLENIYEI